jgi:hypothetical protein
MKIIIVLLGILFSCVTYAENGVDLAKVRAQVDAEHAPYKYVQAKGMCTSLHYEESYEKCVKREWVVKLERDRFQTLVQSGTLRPATLTEYADWLKLYLKAGGKVSENRGYWTGYDHFYTATKNFKMLAHLQGSSAIRLLVPKGIKVELPNDIGHSIVYQFKKPMVSETYFIPIYEEME